MERRFFVARNERNCDQFTADRDGRRVNKKTHLAICLAFGKIKTPIYKFEVYTITRTVQGRQNPKFDNYTLT